MKMFDVADNRPFGAEVKSMAMDPSRGVVIHHGDFPHVFSEEGMQAAIAVAHDAGQAIVTIRAFFLHEGRQIHAVGHACRGDGEAWFPQPFKQLGESILA